MSHKKRTANEQKDAKNRRRAARNLGRFAFIIPAYNHGATVAQVAGSARDMGFPVFVVDDGSTDDTAMRLAEVQGIEVLRHEKNEGKGAAILTGFMAASHKADYAITIDADGQHDPEDAIHLIDAIPLKKRPIVVGAREGMDAVQGAHIPWTSRFGRKFSNFWVRMSGGPKISDTQSGMRIYPLPESLSLPVRARRFQFEVEILVQARRIGIPIIEAPIRVLYLPDGARISHFRPFVDFLRNAKTFTRLMFTRVFGRH
ncbi:MAG: glycosyltransferase family 2 protein [Smithellaceae bacterium]|jgi:glycosyltransferase involved in cell wall biosynthesis|nr:glycosyltransferase family 2 protein [Smithellaceae bacterium]MDD3258718.1 glycosyltransferase family 2 protein [Smithellaceae bacterium]MDD3848702.1 glycosyltransferase family 2 protein [Smithellaceae bacterium]HOG11830.1 glycosyltransferase family 2 protein [Smithellaceae bacterium]